MWRVVDYILSRRITGRLYYFLNYCRLNLQAGQNLSGRCFGSVSIGRHSYGVRQGTILGATPQSPVTIGSFCSIAQGVTILAHVGHRTDLPSTYPFRSLLFRRGQPAPTGQLNHDAVTRGPVVIGHDVWIGQNVTILSGTNIGTGAIIGAGAVISKDVPPYSVVVGNPAQVVRTRFDAEIVTQLIETAWWELSDRSLARLEDFFYGSDIVSFIDAVRSERQSSERSLN